jgi:hypothetical protein
VGAITHDRMSRRSLRLSHGSTRAAVAFVFALAAAPRPARAQVVDTTRADTTAADTLSAPADTIPPPVLVPWPVRAAAGPLTTTWAWNREELLAEGFVSVLDLLARVPGVATFRSGVFLQPEAATLFGAGAARTVIELNGYILDPLSAASLDLATIPLIHLEEVRVERRLDALILRLRTVAPADARPYSRIEAGIGEPSANIFRGVLLAPRFLVGPIGVAIERTELEGAGRPQPADVFHGWLRWGWLSEDRGVELEYVSHGLTREPESPIPLEANRSQFVVRGRNRFAESVVGEAYVGTTRLEITDTRPGVDDSLRQHLDRSAVQAGGRLAAQFGPGGLDLAVRWRDTDDLPRFEYDATATADIGGRLRIGAGGTHQRWSTGRTATSWRVLGEFTPLDWVQLFGEYSGGRRGTALVPPDSTRNFHINDRTGWRAGGSIVFGRLSGGGAAVHVESDSIASFGLPSDTAANVLGGGSVTGWEAWGRLQLIPGWLAAYGSYNAWLTGTRWAWLPASQMSATLELHALPLPSGNLELLGRIDAIQRGSMIGPPALPGETLPELEARTLFNAYLQIRIIDVRIFLRFDDMVGNDVFDAPGLGIEGPRIVYGVKWSFWN